jgi:hypothetical protein
MPLGITRLGGGA